MDDYLKLYVLVENNLVWGEFLIKMASSKQIGGLCSFDSEIIRREFYHS